LNYYLAGAAALYVIGMYCLATKRNMIRLIIAIELLTNAANLNFIAFSIYQPPVLGQSVVVISIALGACVVAVALTIVIYAYRHYKTLDVRELKRLRW
jgi:NADH:ubiquinone oxidoreductase subunit K